MTVNEGVDFLVWSASDFWWLPRGESYFGLVGLSRLVDAEEELYFYSGRLEQTGGCRGGGRVFSLVSLLDKTYSNISGFQSPKVVHFFSFGESDNIVQVRCQ